MFLSRFIQKGRSIVGLGNKSIIKPYSTNQPHSSPPTYFAQHINNHDNDIDNNKPIPQFTNDSRDIQLNDVSTRSNSSRLTPIKDLSIVISILTLTYFAIDNYRTRLTLEQKITENTLNHMKSLAIAQNNYNNHRKKKEIQVLNERKNSQKREMRMIYHVSMLRKQLIDAGVKPVEIDEAIKEFEKNVKMETSISNVSGTALWVVDDSPMKAYAPHIYDYDSKK